MTSKCAINDKIVKIYELFFRRMKFNPLIIFHLSMKNEQNTTKSSVLPAPPTKEQESKYIKLTSGDNIHIKTRDHSQGKSKSNRVRVITA